MRRLCGVGFADSDAHRGVKASTVNLVICLVVRDIHGGNANGESHSGALLLGIENIKSWLSGTGCAHRSGSSYNSLDQGRATIYPTSTMIPSQSMRMFQLEFCARLSADHLRRQCDPSSPHTHRRYSLVDAPPMVRDYCHAPLVLFLIPPSSISPPHSLSPEFR